MDILLRWLQNMITMLFPYLNIEVLTTSLGLAHTHGYKENMLFTVVCIREWATPIPASCIVQATPFTHLVQKQSENKLYQKWILSQSKVCCGMS